MNDPDRLYRLLPAIYRQRDAEEGHPLRAMLRLIGGQADLLHGDVQQLWDNFFIETCERWAIPYIGDLVSNNLLHDTSRIAAPDTARALFPDLAGPDLRPPIAVPLRADVAKTIYYRRRKGTVPMLEELARDVTGWPAHAVEFFELLGWTQFVRNHLRMHSLRTPDIRSVEAIDRLNGPFDEASHTVDVRPIGPLDGWYNIRNVGFFLWRLRSYPLTRVAARPASVPWGFHFSPLGNPAPIFSRWRREGDEAGLATELHVPGPIRRALFHRDLETYGDQGPPRRDATALYGLFRPVDDVDLKVAPEASFFIFKNGVPPDGEAVAPSQDPDAPVALYEPQIVCRRLDPWPAAQPAGKVLAVDVERGRIAVGDGWGDATDRLDVDYHYGFGADLGGGPYERGRWRVRRELAALRLEVEESQATAGAFPTLTGALGEWVNQGRPNAVITILDNRTYAEDLGSLELADQRWLAIEAANGRRPHLLPANGEIVVTGDHPGSELTLNGLLVEGGVRVEGDLRRLRLLHTTLVPGRGRDEDGEPATTEPSLVALGTSGNGPINAELRVEIAFSITGPLRLPEHAAGLWALDSIVDGLGGTALAATGTADEPGPAATFERVTVFGRSYVKELPLGSETIFTAPVVAERRQQGCVRFSFVPHGSRTPRRYRCQGDLEIAARIEAAEEAAAENQTTLTAAERQAIRDEVRGWLVPAFTSRRYGEPAYAQLHLAAPAAIRTGAEDGSEMGAFCHLKQPQRETNLRIRLEEYLPFGLEPGIVYVT